MKIYLLMNETILRGVVYPSTSVAGAYLTLQGALDALEELGKEFDASPEGASIYLPPTKVIESDEYYIEEIEAK